MSDLISRAVRFATAAHERIDHRRKYTGKPYADHLKQVATIVSSITDDEEMIAAAWLHDVVEDTPATLDEIEREFGTAVARLVRELTDVSRPGDGNRAVRKAIDRAHLAAASARAQTIKLADLIDNCRDITAHDPRFAKTFLQEMDALLEVLDRADPGLMGRARRALERGRAQLLKHHEASGDTVPLYPEEPDPWSHFRHQFDDIFSARDIAEPLRLSFDAATPTDRIAAALRKHGCRVATVRRDGKVTGYVTLDRLDTVGPCGAAAQSFATDQILDAGARFTEVIHVLTRHDYCFIAQAGEVQGVITRSDVNKPYMRMWLFGIITLTEMLLNEWLKNRFPEDTWQARLPQARLEAARKLQKERERLGQPCGLIECLQMADKGLLLVNDEELLARFGFPSRSVAKKVIKQFQSLRNNLAHAQDISSYDWAQIARMSRRLLE